MKRVLAFIILLAAIPLVFSISIKELISRYSFSAATQQMNVTGHADFMIDKNGNGIDDTLIFELTTNNTAGTFIFVINLFDKNGILTNETNKTLSSGINKLNVTFASILLSQSQFNYSIKVYNASRRQKYRKDNILTQNYSNYEEGFRILNLTDLKVNKTLLINLTISSPENKSHVTTLFLKYNNSIIFSKGTKSFKSPTINLIFAFDNETIKKTHFIGNFTVSSVKIGFKTLKVDFSTKAYDFRDFAATSYVYNFTDNGTDTNGNSKYDFLEINASMQIFNSNNYTINSALYDLFGNIVEIKNTSSNLNAGKNIIPIRFNGSAINEKKLNGPYLLKNAELYENGTLADKITDAYTTANYNFNDFDADELPDITANISASDNYRYGISNITINFTFANVGSRHAFNVATDIFDNKTFAKSNKSNILDANSRILYQLNFTNISDFEATAIADLQNIVEELNESNNAHRITIKLNKKPNLAPFNNITVNETAMIVVNLSASDQNDDALSYSVNFSKFSNKSNVFGWNTTLTDSGNYTLMAAVSDGYLNDTFLFRVAILNSMERDTDNDGIDDSIDNLIGDKSSVNTSTIDLGILVGDSTNLSKLFNGSLNVVFMDNNRTIVEFIFNFSKYRLNLTNITINKQASNATGSLLVRGLKMPNGTKSAYIDRLDSSINGVCIKEEEIASIAEISSGCSSGNEFKIECDGTLQSSYICTYNSTISKYKVQGLMHSGILQIDYAKTSSSSGSSSASAASSSGGGGGGFACISDWLCSEWLECVDGFKSRKCADKNQCTLPSKKPVESEQCAVEESKFIDIIKPLGYVGKSINKIKQNIQKPTITGLAAKSLTGKPNLGIFIIFFEVVLFVGAYLVIKRVFLKNL